MTPKALALARLVLSRLAPPPEPLPFDEWIESELVLPSDVSASPGKVRLSRPQRGIAEALGDPALERVSILKSARVGASTLLSALVGYLAKNDPGPIIFLQPRDADCRDFAQAELEPTFNATPCLRGLLDYQIGGRGKRRGNLTTRFFPGGNLRILAARSPRNLRRISARYLLADEVEGYQSDPTEGDVMALAERRTQSFAQRRILQASTPKLDSPSFIVPAFEAGDRRLYHVRCIGCHGLTPIEWKDIEWPEGQPAEAYFRCPLCNAHVRERHKHAMIEGGAWIATHPEAEGHASFRWNSLISELANATWGKLASEFVAVKDDPTRLQVFVNTVLGEPWRAAGDELDDTALISRREGFSLDRIPSEVLTICAGVDLQHDRAEIVFCGFDRAGTAFVLGHMIAWGPITEDSVWQDLDDLLKQQWRHPGGGLIGVDACCVDCGDGAVFDKGLQFCNARSARRVFAIKGASGFARPAFQASFATKKGIGKRLYIVGVDGLKLQLFERLRRGQTIRFSETLELVFFEQLASERLVTRMSRGRPQRRFEAIPGRRSECLDGFIYAMAARSGLALNLATREAALKQEPPSAQRPQVIKSRWLTGDY